MNRSYVYKTFAVFCVSFILVYSGFVATHFWQKNDVSDPNRAKLDEQVGFSSVNLIKPNYKIPDSKHLTRVEVEIKDDLLSPHGKVLGVWFNDDSLSLNPADHYGRRGSTLLQLTPGLYTIEWTVKKSSRSGPSETRHIKQIEIKPTDLWIHIIIQGKDITIG